MRKLLLTVAGLLSTVLLFSQDYRYINRVFATVDTDSVVYETAPILNYPYNDETDTVDSNFWVDIFTPVSDTLTYRPLIIFAHGGGFIEGNRHHDDMMAFCDTFAHAGYVTATIDYRQGMYTNDANFTPISSARAVYRGLQDLHAAIRFFRANYSTYGIDTNRIYVVGSSAGAFMALHDFFMTDPAEKPAAAGDTTYTNPLYPYNTITAPDLGGFDVGQYLNHSGIANLIVSLWGAVGDTAYINSTELKPMLLVHGTADTIVFFKYGHPFNYQDIPETYGSYYVDSILTNKYNFTDYKTYFVPGVGHEFYGATNGNFICDTCPNAYWDTIVNMIKTFMWEHNKPTASFTVTQVSGLEYNFTYNGSSDAVYWRWTVDGVDTVGPSSLDYTFSTYGTHKVTLYVANEIASWDTVSQYIQIATDLPQLQGKFAVYPNPAKNYVSIFVPQQGEKYDVQIVNSIGQTVYRKTTDRSFQVSVSNLSPGVYFVNISNANSKHTFKLLIER